MNGPEDRGDPEYLATAIPIGAGAGVALGVVLMNVADNPAFLPLAIAIGMIFAIAIGLALEKRE